MSKDKMADGDKAAEQATSPIKPEEVVVTVKPREEKPLPGASKQDRAATKRANEERAGQAKKATDAATKEVRDAVRQAAPGGRPAQKQAAADKTDDVSRKLSPRTYDSVQTQLPGEAPIVKKASEGAPPPPPKK